MSETTIQDILPLVQRPSRYLGCEVNRIKKPWEAAKLHVVLAFPDLYEIASSHFGIQILYGILNAQEDILAERVFAPAVDLEAQLRKNKLPLSSLESAVPISKFDIIGFSLLYELNYTNMVNMLDLSGIVFFSSQRNEDDPFVIAGGPCMCNPEPVADFFDAIVIGDGEAVLMPMTEAWKAWRQSGHRKREDLLQRWSRIKGVYIPSFFDVSRDENDRQRLIPKKPDYQFVRRAVISDLNDAPFPTRPLIPFGKPIHDRLRVEIARGCTRGCRFCQAGMIYRPVRERRPQNIFSSVRKALQQTGYEDLSLLSLSTGDYSCIAPLLKQIMEFVEKDRVAVSLPSLRAGSLTPELMELIKKVRKTGFTIAPEAGSQRLRDVINKNISDADIEDTVNNAFFLGWKIIKLYFMIGLPTETQEDLEAIVSLVKRLKTIINGKGRRGKLNVSIATFVPKPHTPFQWEKQISLETAMQKMTWLKDNLKISGVQVKWQDPRVSLIEGIWARGDRGLGRLLISAWDSGCRFDGWSDFFNFERWATVFEKAGIDLKTYAQESCDSNQKLPWEHIHIGVERDYLLQEWSRAKSGNPTFDCRTGSCSGCGVCDFRELQPVSYHGQGCSHARQQSAPIAGSLGTERSHKYVVTFTKMGSARFLGHLEMINVFARALRRINLPVKYSRGFHPMPKITFCDTLPMGMQSEEEKMIITLTDDSTGIDQMLSHLGQQMPEGIEITGGFALFQKQMLEKNVLQKYHIELKDGYFLKKNLELFTDQEEWCIERKNKKGNSFEFDLKKAISKIEILNHRQAWMTISRVDNITVRPSVALKSIFNLTDHQIQAAIITKRKMDHV